MKILGFDLGDGESAVTLFDDDSTVEPRVVPLCGRASIISAVGLKDGQIVIGEDASVLSGAINVHSRFKAKYLSDPSMSGVVRLFAQGVVAQLMREEPALMASVGATVVGCPAGWGAGRREQYAALMESAGFPNVFVVPEPRAAFLYARHARGLRIDPTLMRTSAMVVDIGSSTTDFAYIVDGKQQNLSLFGDTNLGGGVIDELILEQALKESADGAAIRAVFEKSPAWRSYCELRARRLKEAYFMDEMKWESQSISRQVVICYDETLMLDLSLNKKKMDALIHAPVAALGARSFVNCLEDALHAAQEISQQAPPQAVILTGGASRMAFFRETVQAAFPKSVMVLCPEPECSIARGLAYAGSVDEKLRIFREEVASLSKGERLSYIVGEHVYELYRPLAQEIYEIAQECALEGVRLWRKGAFDTIQEMEAYCAKAIAQAISGEAMRDSIEEPLKAWLAKILEALEAELAQLCERCGIPPERMALAQADVPPEIGVNLSVVDAMGLNMLLSAVLAAIGATVCGGSGMALVAGGPLGILIGAVLGVLLAFVGRGGVEYVVKKIRIPAILRLTVTDSAVRLGILQQRKKIEASVIAELSNPANGFSSKLCAALSRTLGTQLEEMAKNAEMSIEA